ncbi:hypothetical protein TrCOL_g6688 [Triparma columacea]|uniref:HSF-type DNA-binding domain-containing protein n=1 Tax=Triparma columacea TaxID=722753 RepID=A0A9W7GQC6_9STRA|nr:hypothetical protein TrCOL_g6688 [Triparma columacea]
MDDVPDIDKEKREFGDLCCEDVAIHPPPPNVSSKTKKRPRESSKALAPTIDNETLLYQAVEDYQNCRTKCSEVNYYKQTKNGGLPETLDANIDRFPSKMMKVVEEESKASSDSEQGDTPILSWYSEKNDPCGTAFIIWDKEKFVESILPKHFRHSNFTSFQRQLNMYGFRSLHTRGQSRYIYQHECFNRFEPTLVHQIKR